MRCRGYRAGTAALAAKRTADAKTLLIETASLEEIALKKKLTELERFIHCPAILRVRVPARHTPGP
jgi:hypothetical protein